MQIFLVTRSMKTVIVWEVTFIPWDQMELQKITTVGVGATTTAPV